LGLALGLNFVFLGVEFGVGWWTQSLALLSDAAHMASDVGALVLALAAAQLARRKATNHMTYGLARAEVLGAFVNGLGLLVVCALIVREGLARLVEGPPAVPGVPVLVVGVIGLAINLGSAWILHRADDGDLNVRGALFHMLSDALGSVAAIVAAVFLMFGVGGADPIASLIVGALVAVGAVSLVRDAGRVLLELPPRDLDVAGVHQALMALDGVVEVHDLHAWSLDGRTPLVSAHLVVQAQSEEVCDRARAMLDDRFQVHHATLQIERAEQACGVRCGDA
jgi:cobalt-zinc-cadmium efflux system protein